MLENIGMLAVVAVLWGVTNPFIKRGTKGLRTVTSESKFGQAYAEVKYLFLNWQYVIPWLVNQAGSLVYVWSLQSCPLSLAVPVANSLALAMTAVTSKCLGEEPLSYSSLIGVVLIVAGSVLCCLENT